MERIICDLCEQDDAHLLYRVQDNNYGCSGDFILVRCRNCGLVYLNPRPSMAEIGAYYPVSAYHPFKALHDTEKPTPALLHQQRADYLSTFGAGTVLDVGCGSGLFLLAMKERGWRVTGLEPNEMAAQFGRDVLQLDVQTGDIFTLPTTAVFDLITFWDVLEHTHSPRAVLQYAHSLLQPAGILAINVPNWGSLERHIFRDRWIAIDAPRHLYHFTPQTVVKLLEMCGFLPTVVKASAPPLSLASNVLRWLGDTFLRNGQAKVHFNKEAENSSIVPASPNHGHVISLIHHLVGPPNAVANLLNRGAGIMVIAQKANLY